MKLAHYHPSKAIQEHLSHKKTRPALIKTNIYTETNETARYKDREEC